MANLTADYDSSISNQRANTAGVIDDTKTFYAGGLVQADNDGKRRPLLATSTNKCLGQHVRVSPDGLTSEVREGDITLDNATAGDACAQADVGKPVYATDDHTVSDNADDGGSPPVSRPKVGILVGFNHLSKPVVRCALETTTV